ncbi:DUF5678 domain-containing protein [Tychonema bourrellyi]|uniref:DUF5678 domain-containing protein n=1 Tax=Tychonema bourrellyi TaxID=54313 RepID=UPI001FE7C947|nr:DUF5678 domain-containing protein [Tychonema bourrellyi]
MEAEYTTVKEWYRANRREFKKYRGQWIAYTNQGVISCDRDYRKMKDGMTTDIPKLGYLLDRIYESEFIEPVRFYPVRMRSLKSHDWRPRYEVAIERGELDPFPLLGGARGWVLFPIIVFLRMKQP